MGISTSWIKDAAQKARDLARERLARYRKLVPLDSLKGKTILLVDDGVATGATMLAEIKSLRKKNVHRIIAISPVAAIDPWAMIEKASDKTVCLNVTESLLSVSHFYAYFPQVEDEEVLNFIQKN
jgi:predicted phosphoribosyltransferase